MNNSRTMLLATAAGMALALAQPALASADAPPAPQAAPGGLEDIVVTARRKVESAQNIPVSVAAISSQQIQRMDLTSLEKITTVTPQFQIGRASNGSGAQLTLRGIGSSSTSIGVEQSVAVVVDGVYYGSGRIINEGFFDLARVEVLKGPQALYFGKNATAGVVNIVTQDPTDHLTAHATASYEFTAKQPVIEAVVSGPLTDTLGIRAGIRYGHMFGGYFDTLSTPFSYPTFDVATGVTSPHTALPTASRMPGEDELVGRVTLKWKPDPRFTATIKASFDRDRVNNNSYNYVPYRCEGGFAQINPADHRACSTTAFASYQLNMPADIAQSVAYSSPDGLYNKYRSAGVTATFDYKLDHVDFISINNYNRNVNMWECNCAFGEGGTWATERSTMRSISSENRVQTDLAGPLNGMLGLLYQNTKRWLNTNIVFANLENSAAPASQRYLGYMSVGTTDGETLSVYGQASLKLMHNLEATGGVRYTHETKDSTFIHPYVNPALTAIFVEDKMLTAHQVFENWAPEATLSYRPTSDITIYGAYKTAYKSGGFSISGIYSAFSKTPYDDMAFDPEKGRGFEMGIKTMLFDRQLRFNLGVFRYKYTNLQVDFFNSPIFAFQTINAGAAVTKGVEVDFDFKPRGAPGLSVHGSLAYDRARYENFQGPCYAGQTIAQGCSLTGPSGAPFQDLSGKPTMMAPDWVGALGLAYEGDLAKGLRYAVSADTRYSASYLASQFGHPWSRQSAYATLDMSARIMAEDERWEVAVIGKNLTDRLFITGIQDRPGTGSAAGGVTGSYADQIGFANTPRTVMVQLTWRIP